MRTSFVTLSRPVVANLLVLGFGCYLPVESAHAATPSRVTIDVGPMVECRDVTPPEFAAAHSNDKIVEATFHVSVLLESGREEELDQLRLAVDSPQRRLPVVDFQPRSELASELACDVEVSKTAETIQSLNASLGGVVGADQGPAHAQIAPSAGVGVTQNRGSKEVYHRLAPKQLVLASGTTNAEHGVFFKWRRSSQVAIEGAREATVRFLVPRAWRGDWVQLDCEVMAKHRNCLGERLESCGQSQVFVGLYLAGDDVAQQAARALSQEQSPTAAASSDKLSNAVRGRYVSYKPAIQSPWHPAQDWPGLTSLFKVRSDATTGDAAAPRRPEGDSTGASGLQAALDELRQLSAQ